MCSFLYRLLIWKLLSALLYYSCKTHSGRLLTRQNDEIIDKVRTLVMVDHHVTIQELAYGVGISVGSSIRREDLCMWRVSAKSCQGCWWQSKSSCIRKSHKTFWNEQTDTNYLDTVITGDESWFCGYDNDPQTKFQSLQWKYNTSSRQKKSSAFVQ